MAKKIKKFIEWLKKHTKIGKVTDFEGAEKCDKNLPCRKADPREVGGIKFKTKF